MQSAGIIEHILIDAEDSQKVANFWSQTLGRPIGKQYGPYIELETPAGVLCRS